MQKTKTVKQHRNYLWVWNMKSLTPTNKNNGVMASTSKRPAIPLRRPLFYGLFLFLILTGISSAQDVRQIDIVLSATTSNYVEVATEIQRELLSQTSSYTVHVSTLDALQPPRTQDHPDLVVTVGMRATKMELAKGNSTPIIAALVPHISYRMLEKMPENSKKAMTAVYLDQPISRQLSLAKQLLPTAQTAAVIIGAETQTKRNEIKPPEGLSVRLVEPADGNSLLPTLKRKLRDADLAVMVYDPAIINTKTVKQSLYYSYRKRLPLIAYSKALVNAGALAAVFATNQQIGRQTVSAIAYYFKQNELPAPTYTDDFEVHCNEKVARYLDLPNGCAPAYRPVPLSQVTLTP